MKLCIIFGGQSPEHEVSCNSAFEVLKSFDFGKYSIDLVYIDVNGNWFIEEELHEAPPQLASLREINKPFILNNLKNYDLAFPILHGEKGEDGTIQGLLELFNVKYVGNGLYPSVVAIDKIISKQICETLNIPQVPYIYFDKVEWRENKEHYMNQLRLMGFPLFVKPPKLGSSVGITKAEDEEQLVAAIALAFEYGERVLVEQGIEAREIEIGVLGNDTVELSVIGEVAMSQGSHDYYDYEAKYNSNNTHLIIPAKISNSTEESLRGYAELFYKHINCKGLARIDFFLTSDNQLYFNEINTFPGFTSKSMYPLLWQKTNLNYPDLINKLIQLGLE